MVVIGEQIVPAVLAHEDQSWVDRFANDPLGKAHPLTKEDHGRLCARRYASNFVFVASVIGPLPKQQAYGVQRALNQVKLARDAYS